MITREDLGPIDSRSWPQQLDAHAVTANGKKLFGYDVEGDLAAFYRFSDVVFLSLVGELPDDARSRAFEITLCFLMPLSVAHAAIHAAALSRLCGARSSGVLSASSLILGEQACNIVTTTNALLAEFEINALNDLPDELRVVDESERASVAKLAELVGGVFEVPALRADLNRDAALIAVLRACGITTTFQLISLIAFARLPSALAEAARVQPGDFASYPLDTPHFEYVDDASNSELGR